MTPAELAAVAAGAPMPVTKGWMSVARDGTCAVFLGNYARISANNHRENHCGGRRFRVEVREVRDE